MKNKGFTLIELVVVIVILGILAAVAAPKFMDLQTDARISAINGLKGAIKSAVNMAYAKSIIQGADKVADYCGANEPQGGCESSKPSEVHLKYGIPAGAQYGLPMAMQDSFFELQQAGACDSEQDWCVYYLDANNQTLVFAPKASAGLNKADDYSINNGKITVKTDNSSCALVYAIKPDATSKSTSFDIALLKGGC